MLFQTAFTSAVAILFASQAIGASLHQDRSIINPPVVLIATDPGPYIKLPANITYPRIALIFIDFYSLVSACNCPNNCSHKAGSSCKYYSGPSDNSPVVKGRK